MELRQKNPRRQGDLGEAAAIHSLTELGAGISVPLFHSPDYDLVAELGGRLFRVQVKTSTRETAKGRFAVQLATSGGNQSWTGVVKRFSADRCDFLFALVADQRMWFIPSAEIEATSGIVLGGSKFSEFELGGESETPFGEPGSRIASGRGSAGVGEPGRSVKSVPSAEWVRFPPPPLSSAASSTSSQGVETPSGRTRISANHQMTIPLAPFHAAELRVGDAIKVEARGPGRVELTRTTELAASYAASLLEPE